MRHLPTAARLRPRYSAAPPAGLLGALLAALCLTAAVATPAGAASTFLFSSRTDYATATQPRSVAVADLNGDGKPDIATADGEAGAVSVLLGKGGGAFEEQKTFAAGKAPSAVAIGDVNGDGKPDVLVANAEDGTVSVLVGKGDGSFEAQKTFAAGKAPSAVAIGDVNGDGKPDVLVANAEDGTVSVLVGKGDGSFEEQKTFAAGKAPSAVAIGDVNGDGKPDVLVANAEDGTVSVLLGKGDGSFEEQKTFAAGESPKALVLADVNGDKRLDALVADAGSSRIAVLLGKGDGSFEPPREYETGKGSRSLAVADLNGDGKLDVVSANSEAGSLSILLGKGDGSFTGKSDLPTAAGPLSVAIADLNADAKNDLVTADAAGNAVSVLLNASVPALATSAASLTFPGQLFGTKSTAQKVTVTNAGAAPLAITAVTATGNFGASGCAGSTLAPGANCSISVVFGPKGYGKLTGEVAVASNAGAGKVSLSGTGLPPFPLVTTGLASEIVGIYATLTGSVVSQGPGTFYFQYGTSKTYGSSTPPLPLSSSSTAQLLTATLALAPGTSYHYRLVATNLAGTVAGVDQTFTVPPEAPSLKVLKHGRLGSVLRKGLRLRVAETSATTVRLRIFLDPKTARAAHLVGRKHRSRVTIGTARVSVTASGAKRVTISFSRSARRHLAGMRRLRLTIEAIASTSNGVAGEPADVAVRLKR